jgi:hypothetical protein
VTLIRSEYVFSCLVDKCMNRIGFNLLRSFCRRHLWSLDRWLLAPDNSYPESTVNMILYPALLILGSDVDQRHTRHCPGPMGHLSLFIDFLSVSLIILCSRGQLSLPTTTSGSPLLIAAR